MGVFFSSEFFYICVTAGLFQGGSHVSPAALNGQTLPLLPLNVTRWTQLTSPCHQSKLLQLHNSSLNLMKRFNFNPFTNPAPSGIENCLS